MTDSARAAFEAWERSRGGNLNRHQGGLYANNAVQGHWTTWQAARKAALEEAAQVCDTVNDGYEWGAEEAASRLRALADGATKEADKP
jgi:hypothetical protein